MFDLNRPLLAHAPPEILGLLQGDESTTPEGGSQETQANPSQSSPAPAGKPASPLQNPLFFMLFLMVMLYVFVFFGRGKKQKQVDGMLRNLKKNDRVVTIGGIVGTVVATREDEVVVKVDESTNTKMTFVRKAIQRVLPEDGKKPSA